MCIQEFIPDSEFPSLMASVFVSGSLLPCLLKAYLLGWKMSLEL